jgi:uncharacterized protein YqiB (DUF1249 family)
MTHATKSNLLKRILNRRSFVGLMDLYEGNHRLLQQLVSDLASLGPEEVSCAPGSPDLHLRVVERCKFTTTLLLTYYFEDAEGKRVADPDLHVRVYHDAAMVEAMSCRRKGFMPLDAVPDVTGRSELDCKWESNLFLEKWLEYSVAQGHSFGRHRAAERNASPDPAAMETP